MEDFGDSVVVLFVVGVGHELYDLGVGVDVVDELGECD